MSKLEELIEKLCPNGVKYVKLSQIANFSQGIQVDVQNQHFIKEEGDVRFLRIIDFTNKNEPPRYIKRPDDKYIKKANEMIMIRYGTPGKVYLDYEGAIANNMFKINFFIDNINVRFYYHYLSQDYIYNKIKDITKSTMPSINFNIVSKIRVPIIPIEVQNEIVRILDDFTELEVELETELEARKKQYEYYKEKMLKFSKTDSNIEWVNLGRYCKRLKGTAITANKMREISENGGNIKIFAGGKTVIETSENNIPQEDIIMVPNIIVQSRGIIDFIYYNKPCSYKREMWSYTNENEITLKFIYYYLKNNVEYFRQRGSQMGSMPQISLDVTEKYKIPIPSLEEQEKIVSILDRFDKLCNDISEGLPAEIEARKKQYEYYRDKLLNFKELIEKNKE